MCLMADQPVHLGRRTGSVLAIWICIGIYSQSYVQLHRPYGYALEPTANHMTSTLVTKICSGTYNHSYGTGHMTIHWNLQPILWPVHWSHEYSLEPTANLMASTLVIWILHTVKTLIKLCKCVGRSFSSSAEYVIKHISLYIICNTFKMHNR